MNKKGLYTVFSEGRYRLMFDGNEVGSFRAKKNSNGLVVSGSSLYLHGVAIASSDAEDPNVWTTSDAVYFGDIPLFTEGKCVNITAEDYSSLLAGEAVSGYSIYSPSTIYNIVDDVSTAPEITYSISDGEVTFSTGLSAEEGDNLIYGNVPDALQHNSEDPVDTVTNKNSPFVAVKYFDQVIAPGDTIKMTYHVDTNDMARLNYDTIETTFTVIVETKESEEQGLPPVMKTTYAGVFEIETPSFDTEGQTWLSIRCVDSNGVGSPTIFIDIFVKENTVKKMYEMTEADVNTPFTDHLGNTYTIVTNDDTVIYPSEENNYTYGAPFTNKAALSAFFKWKKECSEHYDGVVLYNNPEDNNGAGTTYWIDLHSANGFGKKTYYRCEWEHHTILSVEEVSEDDGGLDMVLDDWNSISNYRSGPASKINFDTIPVPYVGMTFGSPEEVYFTWNGNYYVIKVYADTITSIEQTKQSKIPWFANLFEYEGSELPEVGDAWPIPKRNRYFVLNPSKSDDDVSGGGDHLRLPNGFVLDLNGATIATAYCDDLVTGSLIYLNGNIDTHITNGKIKGNYDIFDFNKACIHAGKWAPAEQMHTVYIIGSKFCTFTKLDESCSVGYDWFFQFGNYTLPGCEIAEDNIAEESIDLETGLTVSGSGMVASGMITIPSTLKQIGEVGLSLIGRSGYWPDDMSSGSSLIDYANNYNRNAFMLFYDSNDEFIKAVKTKLYYSIKIPPGADKCRVLGYGTPQQWKFRSGNGPYIRIRPRCLGTTIRDCYIHDSRSSVIGSGEVSGKSYENCVFNNIGKESGINSVTAVLGDFEDSWQDTHFVRMKGCTVLSGHNGIGINYCQQFTFEDNTGISITNKAGLAEGFIVNNSMPVYSIGRGTRCTNPHVLYKGNVIGRMSIYKDTSTGELVDGLDLPLAMEDTVIETHFDYPWLKLKNGINGDGIYD